MRGSGFLKRQGFLYGSAVLIASALAVKVLGALFKIPLANMLGGTGMGYFSAAYGLFMPIYAVSVTGLPAAVAKAVSARAAGGYDDEAYSVKKTALRLFGAVGAVSSVILLAGAYPFCRFCSGDIRALPAVMAIAPCLAAGCLVSVYRGYYEGLRNMYPTAVSQIAEGTAKLVFGLALCYFSISLAQKRPDLFVMLTGCGSADDICVDTVIPYAAAAAVLGITLSSAAGLAYMIWHSRRDERCIKIISSERRPIERELLRTAVPASVGALVTNLTSLIDLVTIMNSLRILVKRSPWSFSGLLSSGIAYDQMPNFIYGSFTGLAVTLFNLVPSVTNMFGKSMLPAAAAAKAAGDRQALGRCAFGAVLASAMISVPAGLGMSVLSEEILSLLFSGQTVEIAVCIRPLKVLGLAVPFLCISSAAFAVLQAADRADIPVKLMAAGAAVKLAGNLILTPLPLMGVTGAAVSTLLCYVIICGASLYCLKKYAYLPIHETAWTMVRIIISGILCGICAAAASQMMPQDTRLLERMVFSCGSGCAIYIISTYFSGIFTKSTLKMLIS